MGTGLSKTDGMNICIIGGGNIGALMAAEFSLSKKHNVRLLTSKASLFSNELIIDDWNDGAQKVSRIDMISADKEKALKGAQVVFITVPALALPQLVGEIYPYVDEGAFIGMIPGSGGTEFYLKRFLNKNCVIFGFQRVHAISRMKEQGRVVSNQGRKNELFISCLPHSRSQDVKQLVEDLFNIPCVVYQNFLNVTFTPSNQILHTSRIYCLFKDCTPDTEYPAQGYFYKDWDDTSSKVLINCDKELQEICRALPFDLSGVKSLLLHYGVSDYKEMTAKLASIKAFENIKTPMIRTESGNFVPDKENRYFTNDFPFGLCVVRGFADILKVPTPEIDKVLKWYEGFAGVKYFEGDRFCGKDLAATAIPQNFRLKTKESIIDFYNS